MMVSQNVRLVASLLLLFFAITTMPANAQAEIPGQHSAEFEQAVDLWLDGSDDLAALQQLSGLAYDGNTAAQILLARIGTFGHLFIEVSKSLTRKERIALLRQPGGLSGRSWLLAASEKNELAAAFLESGDREAVVNAVKPLFEAGEAAVGTRSYANLFKNGHGKAAIEIANSGVRLPPEVAYLNVFMLRSGQIGNQAYTGSARIKPSFRSPPIPFGLTWYPVSPRALISDRKSRETAIEYSSAVPAFLPLVKLCEKHCPLEAAECVAAGAAEIGATRVMPFASPSQALVPDEQYWGSDRIERDIWNLIAGATSRENWEIYAPVSACFVEFMKARPE